MSRCGHLRPRIGDVPRCSIISNLDNGDVLKTFYELGAGATPSVVSVSAIEPAARTIIALLVEREQGALWRLETSSSGHPGEPNGCQRSVRRPLREDHG